MNIINRMGSLQYRIVITVVIMLQVIAAFTLCAQKEGYHYDEFYSYYSTNSSEGLITPDHDWMSASRIRDEFVVKDGEGYNYGRVKLMQTYDVHPPFYYYVLHTVCSITPGIFSKWQGLSVNLVFFILSIIFLYLIAYESTDGDRTISLSVILLYGFSPAIMSIIVFIRMYMMLVFFCMLSLYIHIKALKKNDYGLLHFCLPVFVLTFVGSGIHYYYLVFAFFMSAYMALHLFFDKSLRKNSFIYAASVLSAIAVFVLYYPSMLGHIFRGYRGTEARSAFFDMGNIRERAGLFVGILNGYLLCGTFYILLLLILIMYVAYRYRKTAKMASPVKTSLPGSDNDIYVIRLLVTVTAGYFAVVCKTALMNAEEAVRYEAPAYGLIILLVVICLNGLVRKLMADRDKAKGYVICGLVLLSTVCQIAGLCMGKTVFLNRQDREGYEWAKQHDKDVIVYVYNPVNQWMIWDDSAELMEYDRIYFVDMNNDEPVSDSDITGADRIYVYSVRGDEAMKRIEELTTGCGKEHKADKVRELLYADIYEIR